PGRTGSPQEQRRRPQSVLVSSATCPLSRAARGTTSQQKGCRIAGTRTTPSAAATAGKRCSMAAASRSPSSPSASQVTGAQTRGLHQLDLKPLAERLDTVDRNGDGRKASFDEDGVATRSAVDVPASLDEQGAELLTRDCPHNSISATRSVGASDKCLVP